MLSTNDDVLADPGFVKAHFRCHEEARREGRVVIVSGFSPWVVHEPDRAFDASSRNIDGL